MKKRSSVVLALTAIVLFGSISSGIAFANSTNGTGAENTTPIEHPTLSAFEAGSLIPSAENNNECGAGGDNVVWALDGSTLRLSGTGDMASYEYASDVPWYAYRATISSIEIGSGITSIGTCAFSGCSNATQVTIPEGVTHIDGYAFRNCTALGAVNLPSSLVNIGYEAFRGCTSLESVDLPAGLRNLGGYFDDSEENGWNNHQGTFGSVFAECTSLASVSLPSELEYAEYAFNGCSALKNVSIANGTSTIPKSIFEGCSGIEEVTFPTSVLEVQWHAFCNCENLKTVHFNEGLITIGDSAFYNDTSLTEIALPESLRAMDDSAFGNCANLATINIPFGLTRGYRPFMGCTALTNVTIEDGMTAIPSFLFFRSGVTTITIPEGVGYIDGGAFQYCTALETVNLPSTLVNIGYEAFRGCTSLESVDLPAGLRNLGGYFDDSEEGGWNNHQGTFGSVFAECTSLASVSLPSELEYAEYAFNDCNALVNVTMVLPSDLNFETMFNTYGCSYQSSNPLVATMVDTGVVATHGLGTAKLTISRNNEVVREINLSVIADSSVNSYDLNDAAVTGVNASYYYTGKPITCSQLQAKLNGKKLVKNVDYTVAYENNTAIGTASVTLSGIGDYLGSKVIQFSIVEDNRIRIRYDENSYEYFGQPLETYLEILHRSSYNNYGGTVARLCSALSCAAYEKDYAEESFHSLGFENSEPKYYVDTGLISYLTPIAAYTIGTKTISSDETMVLVAIRGSGNPTHIEEWDQWLTDFSLGFETKFRGAYHAGFYASSTAVIDSIKEKLGGSIKTSNVSYVITGHSLGAGVANVVESRLIDMGVPTSNVYGYNFACPDTATGAAFGWSGDEYRSIYNICCSHDPVTFLPGVLGNYLWSNYITYWGKFGNSMWFCDPDWNESSLVPNIGNHHQEKYLQYLRKEYTAGFKSWWDMRADAGWLDAQIMTLIGVHCPVDFVVKDSNGSPVASVTNGVVDYHNNSFGQVVILTSGDEKVVAVPANEGYSVELVGTGKGVMQLDVCSFDVLSESATPVKTFQGVALESGKQMLAEIPAANDITSAIDDSKTKLYVVGKSGAKVSEVAENGKETPLVTDAVRTSLSNATVSLPKYSYPYSGSAITPVVSVKMGSTTLKENTDYTVAYSNNDGIGTATVTITGIGNYTDSKTVQFAITSASESSKSSASTPSNEKASEPSADPTQEPAYDKMYRLYNPWSGEHFYTANESEKDSVEAAGWTYEGVGWKAPISGDPVYRLYNSYAGEHHYTLNIAERDSLIAAGWTDEDIGWYSDPNKTVPLYREYNPYMFSCNHNYTADKEEHDGLVALGWHDEDIGWYGV